MHSADISVTTALRFCNLTLSLNIGITFKMIKYKCDACSAFSLPVASSCGCGRCVFSASDWSVSAMTT